MVTLIITVCAALVLIAAAVYLHFENTALVTEKYTVYDERIGEDDIIIAHVSDYHNTHSEKLRSRLVSEIAKASPDIIVITGDIVDSRRTDEERAEALVRELCRISPVCYVSGNHESRLEDPYGFFKRLASEGASVMNGKSTVITKGKTEFVLCGLGDPSLRCKKYRLFKKTILSDIRALGKSGDAFRVLLVHRPEYISLYADKGFDLILAGHAHGGQVRIPLVGGLIAPNQGWFPKYTEGIYRNGGTHMIVSRGIGNSSFPFRINDRPTLVAVTLKNGNGSAIKAKSR